MMIFSDSNGVTITSNFGSSTIKGLTWDDQIEIASKDIDKYKELSEELKKISNEHEEAIAKIIESTEKKVKSLVSKVKSFSETNNTDSILVDKIFSNKKGEVQKNQSFGGPGEIYSYDPFSPLTDWITRSDADEIYSNEDEDNGEFDRFIKSKKASKLVSSSRSFLNQSPVEVEFYVTKDSLLAAYSDDTSDKIYEIKF